MNAEQIRAEYESYEAATTRLQDKGAPDQPTGFNLYQLRMQCEIAAQLAEQNEYSEKIHIMHQLALAENIKQQIIARVSGRVGLLNDAALFGAICDAMAIPESLRRDPNS